MDIFEAIKNRRSIRHYKPDPVDDKTVEKVLEAAHWAPSWGNQQCWRFVVVRDPKTKSDIADTLNKVTVDNELVDNAAADSHIKINRNISVDDAIRTDLCALSYHRPRPDISAITDLGIVLDHGAGADRDIFAQLRPLAD